MNPRQKILLILACLIAMPIILAISLNSYFPIVDYNNIKWVDFKKLIDFMELVVTNLFERKMKLQIYYSVMYACIPLIIVLSVTLDVLSRKDKATHGKARFATKDDIEHYGFSLSKFILDYLRILHPKNCYMFLVFGLLTAYSVLKIYANNKGFPKEIESYYIPIALGVMTLICIVITFKINWNNNWKFLKTTITNLFKFGMGITHPIRLTFDKGFLLGIFKDLTTNKPVYYDQPLSAFIVAPPGAGKSASIMIPNLLTVPTSCIVTDIKGELCDLTAGYRQKVLKNKIYIFNPFGDDNNLKFNPFDKHIVGKLNFNQIKRLVDEIANTIFVAEKGGNDAHWNESAKNLFSFYALYECVCFQQATFFGIARGPKKDYAPLINPLSPYYKQLWETDDDGEFIEDDNGKKQRNMDAKPEVLWYQQVADQKYTDPNLEENFKDETEEEIQNNVKNKGYVLLDEVVRDYARALANMNVNEFASVKSVFTRFMNIFSNYQVAEATNSMSFRYEDLRKENITLYIKIAQTDIDTLAPLIRILLESIAKNLMTKESKKFEERIYLFLDEFIRFGKLPFLLEMPALCRSYNLVPIYVTQDFAMVEKHYSKEELRIMNGTIAYRILFRMNDFESAEAVSKEIGNFTRENRNKSTSGTKFFEASSSISKEGYSLITAQDILNIPDDEVIITTTGNKAKPLKLKANYYFKNKEYLRRINDYKFDPALQEKKDEQQAQQAQNADLPNDNNQNPQSENEKPNEAQSAVEPKTDEKPQSAVENSNKAQSDESETNNEQAPQDSEEIDKNKFKFKKDSE